MICERIIFAGFGGQGVMLMGQLLAYAGMIEEKHVSWVPSYGPEMRGGTANCHVMVSGAPIGSPLVSHDATAVIAMNLPSLIKFEPEVQPGGLLLINKSLIDHEPRRTDIRPHLIPANDIASELGNVRTANMVMLGAYAELTGAVARASLTAALKKVLGASKEHLIGVNMAALERGAQAACHAGPPAACA